MKTLKERYKRTVERKFKEGQYLIFDKEKGIINEDTGEVIVDIKILTEGGCDYDINADCISEGEKKEDFSDLTSEEGEKDINKSNFSDEEEKENQNENESSGTYNKFGLIKNNKLEEVNNKSDNLTTKTQEKIK